MKVMQRFKQKPLAKFAWHTSGNRRSGSCQPVCRSVRIISSLTLDVARCQCDAVPYHSKNLAGAAINLKLHTVQSYIYLGR